MISELKLFAEITTKQGGEWWSLESNEKYSLWLCKTKHMINNYVYYDQPVYEIFDEKEKRVLATTSRTEAYNTYNSLTNN